MLIHSAQRRIRNAAVMFGDLAIGAYPSYVYGGRARGIPAFCLHGVEAASFEEQVRFLADNKYRTLTADEYCDAMTAGVFPERAALLTFDDGLSSLYSAGLPLARRYGVTMVVFLITARVGLPGFLTWEQISEMHAAGVDFQSHSLTHTRVFTGPRIEDVARPELLRQLTTFQIPEWVAGRDEPLAPGRPLYQSASRMSGARRFLEDGDFRRRCEAFVASQGGERFFERPTWRAEWSAWVASERRAGRIGGRLETDAERDETLRRELAESKRMIEEHLPGKMVRHFAFPWGDGSRRVNELLIETGYASAFPGRVAGTHHGVSRGRLLRAARVGGEWVLSLPGKGRRSLAGALQVKLRRNVQEYSA